MTVASVSVVGVGAMGAPIALRLHDQGFRVRVCDRNPDATGPLARAGLEAVASPAAAAASDVVIVLVANADQAADVLTGEEGIALGADRARPPLVLVMSTLSSAAISHLADSVIDRHVSVIDAPVSGGPLRAGNGGLTVLVGGADEDLTRAAPVLEAIAARVIHCGPLGAGADAKVLNNVIGTVVPVLMGEVLRLAIGRGINIEAMVDILEASSGRTYVTQRPGEAVALLAQFSGTEDVFRSTLGIIKKDLTLAHELAEADPGSYPGVEQLVALSQLLGDETFQTWKLVGAQAGASDGS